VEDRLLRCFLAAVLAGSPAFLRAYGTTMGPYGLGAAALGAGGSAVATAQGDEAFYWNPAALSTQGLSLGYDGGLGGPAQTLQQAVGLSGPLAGALSGGLFAGDQSYSQADHYNEEQAGLGLSAGNGWASIGTVQRLLLASPGSLRGWSMDVGAKAAVPLVGTWRLDLGLSASDLFSNLAWGDGQTEGQPTVLRAGMALEPEPGTWLSAEEDQLESLGGPNLPQWRLGLQVSLFERRLALRLGATQVSADVGYATAGLGLRISSALGLDYAYMALEDGDAFQAGGQRQILSLQWNFGEPSPPTQAWSDPVVLENWAAPAAGPGKPGFAPKVVLKGLLAPTVSQADFDLSGLAGASQAKSWELRIVDASGRVLRTMRGVGPVPKSVHWEGTDDLGDPVSAAAGSSFEIRITGADGQERLVAAAPVVPAAQLNDYVTRAQWDATLNRSGVQRDPDSGGLLYTFYFDAHGSDLTPSDMKTLAAAVTMIRLWRMRFALIDGYAAADEGGDGDALSQARAGAILKALVRRHVILDGVTLRHWGLSHPAATGDMPGTQDRNRRVKLHLEIYPPEGAECIGG
jgi:outer membrane protein OmpA-like peptidoglycan-associated protein